MAEILDYFCVGCNSNSWVAPPLARARARAREGMDNAAFAKAAKAAADVALNHDVVFFTKRI
jgi:hypothetical protein